MKDKIMISYKKESQETAREFKRLLTESGLSPWLDESDLRPGQRWPDELRRQAVECDAMIALIDKAYLTSDYCRMEIFIVRSRNKPVLPVLLEDCINEFDSHEETKGLGDIFYARLYDPSLAGLPLTVDELKMRIVNSAATLEQPLYHYPYLYLSYGSARAEEATDLAKKLENAGLNSWVATRDVRIGENWRQAQARGLMEATAQLLVLDEHLAKADVLRTELMLGEALGLKLFLIKPPQFEHEGSDFTTYLEGLEKIHHTFKRVAAAQAKGLSSQDFGLLAKEL